MTMILNIDELKNEAQKTLVIAGVEHSAAEITLQEYIDRVGRVRDLDKDAPVQDQIIETITMLREMFPTIEKGVWDAMPLYKLTKIVEFALAAPEDIASKVEAASADQAGN